jgi:uncharacterized RDD family membrane protein YckC
MTEETVQTSAESERQEPAPPSVAYAGFWIRFLASVLDSILLLMIMIPLLLMFYGPGVFFVTESPGLAYDIINYGLPILAVVIFWQYRSATPGKIMMGIYIVDARTFQHPPFGRLLLRYLGYYLSMLPLFLGFIWVGIDRRKQGFHDKIAGTVVIRQDSTLPKSSGEVMDNVDAAPPAPSSDAWKE